MARAIAAPSFAAMMWLGQWSWMVLQRGFIRESGTPE